MNSTYVFTSSETGQTRGDSGIMYIHTREEKKSNQNKNRKKETKTKKNPP